MQTPLASGWVVCGDWMAAIMQKEREGPDLKEATQCFHPEEDKLWPSGEMDDGDSDRSTSRIHHLVLIVSVTVFKSGRSPSSSQCGCQSGSS